METKSAGASAAALEYHYDIGNDFYQLWLDNRFLSYTSAMWYDQAETLEQAQLNKTLYHCQQVQVKGAARVLDVGCGWGGLLKYLVEEENVQHVVGLTLNQPHLDYVATFQTPQVEVRREDWTNHNPDVAYDVIFAWGVLEHAASLELSQAKKVAAYRNFFRLCHQWLRPGGWLSLQTIAYGNMRREDFSRFFATQVFPESDLPRLADLAEASARLFEIVSMRNDRQDYARTCREWLSRLKANRTAAIDIVGQDTVARYETYLKLSIIGFHIGTTHLLRFAMRRLDPAAKTSYPGATS